MYYKVVVENDGKIFSSNRIYGIPYNAWIEYKLNEWTYPEIDGSGIFIFKSLELASDFYLNVLTRARSYSYYSWCTASIYKCQVKNPRK